MQLSFLGPPLSPTWSVPSPLPEVWLFQPQQHPLRKLACLCEHCEAKRKQRRGKKPSPPLRQCLLPLLKPSLPPFFPPNFLVPELNILNKQSLKIHVVETGKEFAVLMVFWVGEGTFFVGSTELGSPQEMVPNGAFWGWGWGLVLHLPLKPGSNLFRHPELPFCHSSIQGYV